MGSTDLVCFTMRARLQLNNANVDSSTISRCIEAECM
jgi:hypothetical protein